MQLIFPLNKEIHTYLAKAKKMKFNESSNLFLFYFVVVPIIPLVSAIDQKAQTRSQPSTQLNCLNPTEVNRI